ncbi:MAG: ABC transporter ATP-binding protein [Casimicrobiaceae bacterium]|nr:ABC transporter ATP-binding protein [Casimicrobiaceae bacterium]MCX8099347.1 ABC transporter ATP-binding protein [Casimicrobiaceae bacterium]MDW8311231.1 ABC transporter ATP-binding protein [Burkholderiales bacterium]
MAASLHDRRKQLYLIVAIGVVLLILPFLAGALGQAWVRILNITLLYVMLALGLNVVVGVAGLLDLGYVAFYAVGAYTWALLASAHFGLSVPFWVLIPLGAFLAAVAGLLLGYPVLRLRGDYLAIVTLGFGEIIRILMNNLDKVSLPWSERVYNITNGPRGITGIEGLNLFGFEVRRGIELFGVSISGLQLYYFVFLVLTVLSIIIVANLQHSRLGRAWQALREDEIAAKAMGINVRNIKLAAFAYGALSGGVAGGLFAAMQGFVSPESFGLIESIMILAMVVLGGMGHIPGVILGAVLLASLPEVIRYFADENVQQKLFGFVLIAPEVLRNLIFSLAMILVMLFRPQGLWPAPERKAIPLPSGASAKGSG